MSISNQPTTTDREQADLASKFSNHFTKTDEQYICALGNTYANEFVEKGKATVGFAVLSDHRLYFNGSRLESKEGKMYKHTNNNRIVDVKDITGTGYGKAFKLKYIRHTIISGFLFAILLFLASGIL